MFDNDNLYVLNKKDRNALVYRDSMGNISRLTRNMFDSDNEFEYWKKWSDEDYHDEEKERHIFSDKTLYIDGMPEEAATADSPEDTFFFSLSESEKEEQRNYFMVNYFSQGDSGHAQATMVTEQYANVLDDDRRKNAQRLEQAFYQKKETFTPSLPNTEQPTTPESTEDRLSIIMKLLSDPQTTELLKVLVNKV